MRAIDIHAHWYPKEWLEVFEKEGTREGALLDRVAGGYRLKAKHIAGAFDERFVVVKERIAEMDRRRIGVHALSLTAPMVYWASPGLALALSQAFNDAASAAHRQFPDRLFAAGRRSLTASDLPSPPRLCFGGKGDDPAAEQSGAEVANDSLALGELRHWLRPAAFLPACPPAGPLPASRCRGGTPCPGSRPIPPPRGSAAAPRRSSGPGR